MKLNGLKNLYGQMKKLELERIKFDFSYAKVDFDVIFMIDVRPFVLMFGVKRENIYFEVEVHQGFSIIPFIDELVFPKLLALFCFEGNGNEVFKAFHFFEAFNKSIPGAISCDSVVYPSLMAQYKKDVEESEKIYFCGWIDHDLNMKLNPNYNRFVQDANLVKTRKWLGEKAYLRCRKGNISSRWTDNKDKEILDKINVLYNL